MAKASAIGVCAMSAPRMLKVQAIACGSETTSASARRLAISARMRVELGGWRIRRRSASRAASPRRAAAPGDRSRSRRSGWARPAPASRRRWRRPAQAARRHRWCAATGRSRAWRPPAGWLRASARASFRPIGTIANTAVSTWSRGLQRVAAVDEQRGAVGQHHRATGRAGEAGQPGQPLLGRRHVFVLMAVGARHDEAGEPAPRQLGAQRATRGPVAARCGSSNDWKRASNMRQSMGAGRGAAMRAAGLRSAAKVMRCKQYRFARGA